MLRFFNYQIQCVHHKLLFTILYKLSEQCDFGVYKGEKIQLMENLNLADRIQTIRQSEEFPVKVYLQVLDLNGKTQTGSLDNQVKTNVARQSKPEMKSALKWKLHLTIVSKWDPEPQCVVKAGQWMRPLRLRRVGRPHILWVWCLMWMREMKHVQLNVDSIPVEFKINTGADGIVI